MAFLRNTPLKSQTFTPERNAVAGFDALCLSDLGLNAVSRLLLTQFHSHTSHPTSQSPDLRGESMYLT